MKSMQSWSELVRRDPRVIEAMRKAIKAGHGSEVLLITNIEDFAPREVREAFDALIVAVAAVALEMS